MMHVIALLLSLAPALPAAAQDAGAPAPILRASIEPSRVVVGQPVTLHIEVLAPNYLTTPPVFPDFQLPNAVTRELSAINMSEQHAGVTYAGMRRDFAFHPQEPGAYAVADQAVVVTFAADPPRTQTVTLTLPRLSFEAFIPDAATALDPFIAATRFSLRQAIEGVSSDLKVGDAVIRTVTIEAQGIPAMLLPPVTLAAPAGIAVYPDQPSLQDRSDSRTYVLTATRIDRATYMPQKPGEYVLPAVDLAWWNLGDQTIQRAHADAVTLRVAPNPALAPSTVGTEGANTTPRWRTIIASVAAHWRLVALTIGGLLVLGWLLWRAAPAMAERLRSRCEAYRRSEAAAFAHLRKTARRGDPAAMYFALRAWLERFDPAAPAHTVQAFAAAAQDGALDRELARLNARLFAAPTNAEMPWSPSSLLRRIAAARRKLLHPRAAASAPALPAINPVDLPAPAHARRPVAR